MLQPEINDLIKLYKAKQRLNAKYHKALTGITAAMKDKNIFPFKIGTEGFELIKNKSGQIFLRKYRSPNRSKRKEK
jgi:hypothetical protein